MGAVTTTDILLEKVVGLLEEVRDRLPEPQQSESIREPAAKRSAAKPAAKKTARSKK